MKEQEKKKDGREYPRYCRDVSSAVSSFAQIADGDIQSDWFKLYPLEWLNVQREQ